MHKSSESGFYTVKKLEVSEFMFEMLVVGSEESLLAVGRNFCKLYNV